MEIQIRPAQPSEMPGFLNVVRSAYGLPEGFTLSLPAEWTLCAFADGQVATTYGAWQLNMYWAGMEIPAAGITWVSTHPVYRRRNCLRGVIEAHFRILHERGTPSLAVLHASKAAIYQRYGYAVVSTKNSYSVEPRFLGFAIERTVKGRLREATDNELAAMVDVYNKFASSKVGYLRRGTRMEYSPGTTHTVLSVIPPASPPVKLAYEENGTVLGYVIYTSVRDTQVDPLGQRIQILDMAWLSPEAYNAFWRYFSNLDLVNRVDWGRVSQDDPLPHLLLEPRRLNITSGDDMLGRIIDIKSCLSLRPYPEDFRLSFELLDDTCEWNNGVWQMETEAGECRIKRFSGTPQAVLPISTLAMLFFGQVSPSRAVEMGRMDMSDTGKLRNWDQFWSAPCRPFCGDVF